MAELSDIFVFDDDITSLDDEKIVIIDGHNIAYITVFSTIHSDYSDNGPFKLWKHSFLSKLFTTIKDLDPTKVVLAFDSKNSWRYKLYAEYKANRKHQSGRYPLDKEKFLIALESMIEDVKTYFPSIYTIKVDQAEGDDIMAVLTKEVFNKINQEVIIVTGDTDLNQLLSLPRVRQYNPMKNDFFNVINPKKALDIKILSGDKSDNITPIKRGVGVVNAEKILNMEDGIDSFIEMQKTSLEKELVHENYVRNKKLIDLDFIPQNIRTSIIDAYNEYEWKEIDGKLVVKYFMSSKLNDLMSKWSIISKYIKKLK